jgi:hypothetical protein
MSATASEPLVTLADSIMSRGMAVPAIFFLELHKQLSTLISFGVQATEPLLRLLFGGDTVQTVAKLLESRDDVERLITLLEERSS